MRVLGCLVLVACVSDREMPFAPNFAEAQTVAYRATCGSVAADGTYTAPASGTCKVIATYGTAADTAAVTVLVAPPDIQRPFAVGFWDYPTSTWCSSIHTGVARSTASGAAAGYLAQAKQCGIRLVLVPGRQFITTTGTTKAPFSLDSAKAFTDRLAKVLTPDTLAKYDAQLIGLNLADDYGSTDQWGGTTVSPSQIQAWAMYVKQKMPKLRLGVRVEATWVTSALAVYIDYAWAQYHTGKGDAKGYFDRQASTAANLRISLVTGLNSTKCGGTGTAPCTPDQIKTFMGMAVQRPESCGAFAWDYDTQQMAVAGMPEAWAYVAGLAAQKADKSCAHL